MKTEIIKEDEIDEKAAVEYLNNPYKKLDLLPNVPQKIRAADAALILNVSEPSIQRMVEKGIIELKKRSILDYIFANFLYEKPIEFPEKPAKNQIAPQNSHHYLL